MNKILAKKYTRKSKGLGKIIDLMLRREADRKLLKPSE
jgi:hypothetical protein